MNRSQKAARYGALAEKAGFKRYDLTPDRDSHHDGEDDQGRPWDVKAVMLNRESPHFRLWEDQHRYLEDEDGGYVFVGYVPSGRGIQVRKMRSVQASNLSISFYGAGNHPKGMQKKIRPSQVL
jgi:hypothetical protein